MYKKDPLYEYIKNSDLRIYKETIYIRLSNKLSKNFDEGLYDMRLKHICDCYNQILSLNIRLPHNSNPRLYIYIVPDDNYAELLSYPEKFNKGSGGGKPVKCYDLDGYDYAYGTSQNNCLGSDNLERIRRIENSLHELAHIVCNQFARKNLTISEGLAETIPLYLLDFEDKFTNHKLAISSINQEDILSVKDLINSEKDDSFGISSIIDSKHPSFRISYISSYLFVRGCLETIIENKGLSKIGALLYFLKLLKNIKLNNERLIEYLADEIGINKDILWNGKDIQNKAILSIKNLS